MEIKCSRQSGRAHQYALQAEFYRKMLQEQGIEVSAEQIIAQAAGVIPPTIRPQKNDLSAGNNGGDVRI
jgi:hypothetical protein